jgi:hypothetical protein
VAASTQEHSPVCFPSQVPTPERGALEIADLNLTVPGAVFLPAETISTEYSIFTRTESRDAGADYELFLTAELLGGDLSVAALAKLASSALDSVPAKEFLTTEPVTTRDLERACLDLIDPHKLRVQHDLRQSTLVSPSTRLLAHSVFGLSPVILGEFNSLIVYPQFAERDLHGAPGRALRIGFILNSLTPSGIEQWEKVFQEKLASRLDQAPSAAAGLALSPEMLLQVGAEEEHTSPVKLDFPELVTKTQPAATSQMRSADTFAESHMAELTERLRREGKIK